MALSVGRIVLAFLAAATVAAIFVGLEFWAFMVVSTLMSDTDLTLLFMSFSLGALAFIFAWPAFLIGLALIGGPAWWALHRVGQTSAFAAMSLGAVAAPLVGLILSADNGFDVWIWNGIALILPGGLAGLTARSVAYKPITPPPAPTS